MKEQRCGARADYDRRRCDLPARHPGWHEAHGKDGSRVRWDGGSYEIEVPTRRRKAAA